LVAQLTAETRVAVERHPHVLQMLHNASESALQSHGVLGPPELGTRARIHARLVAAPAYAELREFVRRLLAAPNVAADVLAAIDRAAQAAIDATNALPIAATTTVAAAAAAAATTAPSSIAQLLAARKPVARPVARPPGASRAKPVSKTTIIVPYDAIMIGLRKIQAAERGDASSEDFDSDEDDSESGAASSADGGGVSAPSSAAAAAAAAAAPPTVQADDDATTPAAAAAGGVVHKFACETCGKGFRRKRDMSSHMVNQHGAAPTSDLHVCTDCPMAFAYPNKLASHRQAKHGVAPPEPSQPAEQEEPVGDASNLADDAPPPSAEETSKQEARKEKRKRRRAEAAAAAAADAAATGDNDVGDVEAPMAPVDETPAIEPTAPIVKSKPFACEQCDEGFDRKSRLDRHIAAEHAPPPPKDEADAQPNAEEDAAAAVAAAAAAKKKYACTQCEMRFDRQSRLDKHVAQAHAAADVTAPADGDDGAPPSDKYACEHCEQQFKRKPALDRHIGQAHAAPTSEAAATTADIVTDAAAERAPPTTTASDAKKWTCDQCTAAFDRKGKLASHKASMHGSGDKSATAAAATPTPKRRRTANNEVEDGEADTNDVNDGDEAAAAADAADDNEADAAAATTTTTTPGRASEAKKWACEHCDARFDRKGKLDSHVSARHGDAGAPPKRRRGGEAEEGDAEQ
jgi:uncharacterized C2H2 Zn-finger protein